MQLSETISQIKDINSNFEQINSKVSSLEHKFNQMDLISSRPDFIAPENLEQKNAFSLYLRKGTQNDLIKKSLSSDPGEAGAVIISQLHDRIIHAMKTISPMRQLASIETISTSALDIIVEEDNFSCGWIGEVEDRDVTATPKLKQKRIVVSELYAQPKASQRLIDDAKIDIENWLLERLTDSFVRAENKAFLLGDGNKKPKGFLLDNDIEAIEAGEEVTPELLLHLISTLPEEYLAKATFLMNRQTLAHIQGLKDNTGRFIWQASLNESFTQTIFGIPVVCVSDMPIIADGSKAIALGDFKSGYKIVDRSNISIMRDPFTEKPFIKFYAVKRVGADVINPAAIKVIKFKV